MEEETERQPADPRLTNTAFNMMVVDAHFPVQGLGCVFISRSKS